MFEPMRRADRQLSHEESLALLESGEYGVLSFLGRNGYPHPVPMNYAVREGALWFHCAPEGSKLEDLRADARASFCVVTSSELLPEKFSTRYASVIAYGTVEEASADQVEPSLMALVEKYSPDHLEAGRAYVQQSSSKVRILRFAIDHLTGKARR